MIKGQKVSENIYICSDGKYRWVYELDMLKNPIILFTIWQALDISILIMAFILFLIELFDGNVKNWIDGFLLTPELLIIAGVILLLSLIGYAIVAIMYGWKYMVLFEMDENGIVHNQMQKEFKKPEAMSWLTIMAGVVAGNPTTMGAGILSATKTASSSSFKNVKKVIPKKRLHTIYVNELLEKADIRFTSSETILTNLRNTTLQIWRVVQQFQIRLRYP